MRNQKRAPAPGLILVALCLLCAAATATPAQRLPPPPLPGAQPPPPAPTPPAGGKTQGGQPQQPPTLRKPEQIVVPPARARRSYDRAHNATYVNVEIKLLGHTEEKPKDGPATFGGRALTLTFQLAYRGDATDDLLAVYLIVESVAAPAAGDKLQAVQRLDLKADPYEYSYERTNYRAELVELSGAGAGAPPVRREAAVFKALPEDLPQITGAGRLELKFGAESFTVKSPQLSELRRTLAAGVGQ